MGLRDKMKAYQLRWALKRGYSPDAKGYVDNLALNLFQPMAPDSVADFSRGSGGELKAGNRGGQPKMHALHSSSALACNIFDYWRTNGVSVIGEALGIEPLIERLTFEAQFKTGLRGHPPNLDVALWLLSGDVWAIESKFTEPFDTPERGPAFKAKYFPAGRPVWTDFRLSQCGALAAALQAGAEAFRHLDAAQLLKHALGLQVTRPGRFTLCYLYVDDDDLEAELHRDEIAKFGASVVGDFPFVPLSYTTFLKRLQAVVGEGHDAYFAYISARYGCNSTQGLT